MSIIAFYLSIPIRSSRPKIALASNAMYYIVCIVKKLPKDYPMLHIRAPAGLLALIDAAAAQDRRTRSNWALLALADAVGYVEPNQAIGLAAAKINPSEIHAAKAALALAHGKKVKQLSQK